MESSPNHLLSAERDRTLVIMAKAPKLGMVKTRLAECLPQSVVTELYRCLLEDTMSLARSLGSAEVAIMCPASDIEDLSQLLGDTVRIVPQQGQGLAAGLTSVFSHFAVGRGRVIAFNSDSPHLPTTILESAFDLLDTHDLVLGPTQDGGYYLIGAKAAYATLFDNDGMGTTSALEALLARAHTLGLSTGFTDPFYDIDVASDLIRLDAELQLSPSRAPRTAAWLAQWRHLLAQLRPAAGEP